jgi:hypothetical protein
MKRGRQEAIPRPARPPHILTVIRQEGKAEVRHGPARSGNLGRGQFGMECGGDDTALARSRQDSLLRCPALAGAPSIVLPLEAPFSSFPP